MTTFSEQFPIVFQALNVGFVQTLKLFFVTLIGAIPLGLIISFGSMSAWRPVPGVPLGEVAFSNSNPCAPSRGLSSGSCAARR